MKKFIVILLIISIFSLTLNINAKEKKQSESQFVVYKNRMNYHHAMKFCLNHKMQLAVIKTKEEHESIVKMVNKYGRKDLWIDGNDFEKEDLFLSSANEKLYLDWNDNEPNNMNGAEHCASINIHRKINDFPCSSNIGFVCQKTSEEERKKRLAIYHDYKQNKLKKLYPFNYYESKKFKKRYFFHHHHVNFLYASKSCAFHGYKLVEPGSEEEYIELRKKANKYKVNSYFWIDGNDGKKEGHFVNSNGDKIKFLQWRKGEPNNAGGKENCVSMIGYKHKNYDMNDFNCHTKLQFVCEQSFDKANEKNKKKNAKKQKGKNIKQEKSKNAKQDAKKIKKENQKKGEIQKYHKTKKQTIKNSKIRQIINIYLNQAAKRIKNEFEK